MTLLLGDKTGCGKDKVGTGKGVGWQESAGMALPAVMGRQDMFYVLRENLKYGFYFLKAFLSFAFVVFLHSAFPKPDIAILLFKIMIALLLARRWYKKMKKQNNLQYFQASFACMGMYGILIIATIWEKGELGNWLAFLMLFAIFSGGIICMKIGTDAYDVIKKYDPQLKINTEVRSPDDYFEIFSQAEDLERKLSGLKEEVPPAIVKAIMQREAAKLIPFFHMEMVYLSVLMFTYTPWMK